MAPKAGHGHRERELRAVREPTEEQRHGERGKASFSIWTIFLILRVRASLASISEALIRMTLSKKDERRAFFHEIASYSNLDICLRFLIDSKVTCKTWLLLDPMP